MQELNEHVGQYYMCRTTKPFKPVDWLYDRERSDSFSILQPINKLERPCRTTHEISALWLWHTGRGKAAKRRRGNAVANHRLTF